MEPSLTAEYGEGEKITILPGTTDTARSIYSTQIGSVERISWRESYQIWEERIFSEININVLTENIIFLGAYVANNLLIKAQFMFFKYKIGQTILFFSKIFA